MNLKGGSLKVKEIKAFLEASYNPDAPKDLMGSPPCLSYIKDLFINKTISESSQSYI